MGLYSLGPFYPATAETVSEAPWADNSWVNPRSLSAINANGAHIVEATYDTGDQSYVLKAYNFSGFSAIPAGATILGVQSDLSANYFAAAGAAPQIDLGQLLTNQRTKGGTNQYAAAVELTTATNQNYSMGGPFDLWGNALSAAWLQHSGFGIAIGVSAKSNNTDISADAVRLTVWYSTPDAYTVTNEGGTLVISPESESSYTDAGAQTITPEIEGAAEIGYGGVSTIYFATQQDAGIPIHEFTASADYSADISQAATEYPYVGVVEAVAQVASDRFREKQYESSVAASVQAASERFKAKDYTGSVQADAEAASVQFRAKQYASDVQATVQVDSGRFKAKDYTASAEVDVSVASSLSRDKFYAGAVDAEAVVASDTVRATSFAFSADAAFTVDTGADISASVTGPQAYTYEGVIGAVVEEGTDLLLSFVPPVASIGTVAFESTRFIERLPLADAAWSVDVASDISADITPVSNIEEGTAAWSLAGGVSTIYFATQRDAGVPIHNFVAAGEWLYGTSEQTITVEGSVAAAFSVGDNTLTYDVIMQPIITGSVAESFTYDSVQVIYSTPVYSNYLVDGTATWIFAEPVTEYWVDVASDRAFPLHNFEAVAEYSASGAYQVRTYVGDVAASSLASVETAIQRIPVVGAAETLTFAADTLAIISQQITQTGTAGAVFTTAGDRVQAVVTDGVVTATFAASVDEVPPYPNRDIQVTGDVAATFTQKGSYSVSLPTAHAVEGDVAFESAALAEKAIGNLHEALAEYAAFAAASDLYTPQYGYSYNYDPESVPSTTFTSETKPTDGYTLEAEPTLPAGQDGFWTIEDQDGIVTEPPVQGGYTDIGYFKEWKPWQQTHPTESKPTRSSTKEAKPT